MKFEYFEITNFKGIQHIKINLNKSPTFNVHTFVGLNESGKTTILEAINFFKHKTETLDPLELKGYKIEDIHDIIPIGQRDNFNGFVEITGGLILNSDDEKQLVSSLRKESSIFITEPIQRITFTQKYFFENSKSIPTKDKFLWTHNFKGKKGASKISKTLNTADVSPVLPLIRSLIPNILYFPNFLFDFPNKIYLEKTGLDKKHKFYQGVIQDILDSLNNGLDLETHIIERANSSDKNDKKSLISVLDKMSAKVSTDVFQAWSSIFNKEISKKEILISQDEDEDGVYLEFLLKDGDGTYLINERSLGFRWFFVFLLFTQFRGYRKNNKNSLFLLDEPASNLHSSAQLQLLQSFEKLSEVIYTTHSHHLINPIWLENTYVVKNEGLDYLTDADKFNSSKTKITAMPYREFATKHPNQKNYFQPILDVLDYAPSNLEFKDNSVFVEGKNDFYNFNYINTVILNNYSNINIIPGTASGNMDAIISLYLGWGKKFIIILDSDKEGEKQKKRYIDLFGLAIENLIFTYLNIDASWNNFEIESLYTKEDKETLLNLYYPGTGSNIKSNFNRTIQELLIKKQSIKLSDTTLNNFKIVFDFLTEK